MIHPYLRYPHLHGELLTFVAADDVWLAPVEGGRAWRLTDDHSPAVNPRLSPDGSHVAWAARRGKGREVFAAPSGGGAVTQLTFWGSLTTTVLGWTGDGRVLVSSSGGEHILRHLWLKAISLDGGIERLPYGPASGLALGDDGTVVVGSAWAREPAQWKRYRGGTAPQLWIDRGGTGTYQRLLPEITAGMAWPMWIDGRVAFVSDHDGVANLCSVAPDGSGLRTHTSHGADDGYVRGASTDGGRIVYHALGEVFVLDSLEAPARRADIQLAGTLSSRDTRPLAAADELFSARPTFDGAGVVVQCRGSSFHLTVREGPSRVLGATPGVRVRDSQPIGATNLAVHVTDAEGEDGLEITTIDGSEVRRRIAVGEIGRVMSLQASPIGDRLALVCHDGRILVVDAVSGEVDQVGHGHKGEPSGLAFSRDGRWLVWSQPLDWRLSQLVLSDLSAPAGERRPVEITAARFADFSPAFTSDGKYLAFLSTRTFDPVYDRYVFEIGFPSGTRPYLLPLLAGTPAPFGPSVEGWPLAHPRTDDRPTEATSPGGEVTDAPAPVVGAPAPVDIDVDDLEQRIVAFPVPASDYTDLQAADGAVLWLRNPFHGVLGDDRPSLDAPAPRPSLERFDLRTRKLDVLRDGVDQFQPTLDGLHLLARDGDKLLALPADRKLEADDPSSVQVDLSRIRIELQPLAEWRQMFDEAVRLMRDHFWRQDMGGVDWDGVAARYRPLVERLASRDDLVDLLWETYAELGTSHSYVMPPDDDVAPETIQGLLGVDLTGDDGTWRLARILPGESSDPRARSPLRAAGVGAGVGDAIVEVAGQPVHRDRGPAPALVGTAGRPVELTLEAAADGARRRVVVVPLADEEALRYQSWVADRRQHVTDRSSGRVGYLHIPDMMGPGWAQLHRDLALATGCEGIVVDVRYNRGGHVSQLVIERLGRRVHAYQVGRNAGFETYPHHAPRGPVVFVANQWSGSDGDIVNAMAQEMGIGPVVGVRTWGGVIGIDGRFHLVDGTGVTQPRYATWIRNRAWSVENHGVDPDIEVPMSPGDHAIGNDPQLDRAVDEVLHRLEQQPAVVPPDIPPLS